LIDSVVRLFLTFSSSYFRDISLPEATFGLIGSLLGGIGFIVSPLARRMATRHSLVRNYGVMGAVVLGGLAGVAFRWHLWGVVFIVPLAGSMMILGYLVSYYLNAIVDSSHRATVLSFKGVAFNLGYGFISLVFALVLRACRPGGNPQEAFARALVFLPLWIVIGSLVCAISFWRHRRILAVMPAPISVE
jgi:hypothetical protein